MPTSYRTGRPSFWDRWFGGDDVPDYYAYARHTKDPVVFQEGPVNGLFDWGETLEGKHVPGLLQDEVRVSTTLGNPNDTLKHEQLHHGFPVWNDPGEEEARVRGLMDPDPNVRKAMLRTMQMQGADADYDLIEKILRMRMRGAGNK